MPNFIIIHHKDPQFVSYHINQACKICAREKRATWKKVYYNLKEGWILCKWEAPNKDILEKILQECNLNGGEIVEVEEMTHRRMLLENFWGDRRVNK